MNERQEPISNINVERLFGPDNKRRFNTYREIAIEYKHLNPDGITLTKQGHKIVANWKRFEQRIYDV